MMGLRGSRRRYTAAHQQRRLAETVTCLQYVGIASSTSGRAAGKLCTTMKHRAQMERVASCPQSCSQSVQKVLTTGVHALQITALPPSDLCCIMVVLSVYDKHCG
jgi:hypothetical protein